MRVLKFLMFAGLILALTGTVGAVSLTPGPAVGKFDNYGSFFSAPIGGVDPFGRPYYNAPPHPRGAETMDPLANPAGNFIPVWPGDELRNIVNIVTISPDTVPASFPDFTSSASEQLKGLMYDVTPLAPVVGSGNNFMGAFGRNPVPAAALPVLPGPGATVGGVLEIWRDTSGTPYNPMAISAAGTGPAAWLEGGGPLGRDGFPTINQAGETLWLQMVLIDFPGAGNLPGTVLRESVTFSGPGQSPSGEGYAYAMVTGGSYQSLIEAGGQNAQYISDGGFLGGGGMPPGVHPITGLPTWLTADVYIHFDLKPNTGLAPPWGNESHDPFKFVVVPEPVTMIGLFLSVCGIGGYLRRRRVA